MKDSESHVEYYIVRPP